MVSNSCIAASNILLLRQPVERLATSSSSILDLFFLGAISVSRAMILSSGAMRGASGWRTEKAKQLGNLDLTMMAARSQRGKTLKVTAWVYMVHNGNSVNTLKINSYSFL